MEFLRDLEEKYLTGDQLAELAVEMFCYNIAKTVAAFAVPLAGLDAIVFTGGIGEKSFIKRKKIAGKVCINFMMRLFIVFLRLSFLLGGQY